MAGSVGPGGPAWRSVFQREVVSVVMLLIVLAAAAAGGLVGWSLRGMDGPVDPGGGRPAAPAGSSGYDRYVELARAAGVEPIGVEDAGARAFLLCSGSAEAMGPVMLAGLPQDLALVRAFCPEKAPR